MPGRHFLRSDYLHIFFYIKFLLFVSLVPQTSYLIPHSHQLWIWNSQKKEIYKLELLPCYDERFIIFNKVINVICSKFKGIK